MTGSVPRCLRHGLSAALAAVASAIAAPAHAQTVVSGVISTDTTWNLAGQPVRLSPSLMINGATLSIEPGVEVRFAEGGYLSIGPRGTAPATLVARGTDAQPIRFTADAASPSKGSWASVTFGPNAVSGVRDANGAWVSTTVPAPRSSSARR